MSQRESKKKVPEDAREGPCRPDNDMRERVEEIGLDDCELKVLRAMRLICYSYAHPESHCWEVAFDQAVAEFGDPEGTIVAYRLAFLLRTVQQNRDSVFSFSNPHCVKCASVLASSEKRLITIIQACRHDNAVVMRAEAIMLCEGRDSEKVMLAVEELDDVLPPAGGSAHRKRMIFS